MNRYIIFLSLACLACVEQLAPKSEKIELGSVIGKVVNSYPSILAVNNDTIPLSLVVYSVLGDTMNQDSIEVKWESLDPEIAAVDSSGVVITKSIGEDARIVSYVSYKNVTTSDTTRVHITSSSYDFDSVSVVTIDSARLGFGYFLLFPPPRFRVDLYETGSLVVAGAQVWPYVTVPGINVDYVHKIYGLDQPAIGVTNSKGYVGDFYLYLDGLVYGIRVKDSVLLEGLHPSMQAINILMREDSVSLRTIPESATLAVQPCGAVGFTNSSSYPIDVVFDDSLSPSLCGPEFNIFVPPLSETNIYQLGSGESGARKFSFAGSRRWYIRHSESKLLLNVEGSITVK